MNQMDLESDASANNLQNMEPPETAMNIQRNENDEDCDTQALLQSQEDHGLPGKCGKPGRKVQWLDKNGDKLAEVLEFQPSDLIDSDEEDSDSCNCKIM